MQETGLKWQKIYKWMFDLKTKYAHLVLNPVFGLQQLPKKPIFKIEKVRRMPKASKKKRSLWTTKKNDRFELNLTDLRMLVS